MPAPHPRRVLATLAATAPLLLALATPARADSTNPTVPLYVVQGLELKLVANKKSPSGLVVVARLPKDAPTDLRRRGAVIIKFKPKPQGERHFNLRPRDNGTIRVNVPKKARFIGIYVDNPYGDSDSFGGAIRIPKQPKTTK